MFGVKSSLIVALEKVNSEQALRYGVDVGTALMTYEFVLVSAEAASDLRREKAIEAMASQGRKVRFIDDLPIPDVD